MAKGQMRGNKEKKKPKQDKNKEKGGAAPSPFAGMQSQVQARGKPVRQEELAGAARSKHPPLQGEGRRAKRVGGAPSDIGPILGPFDVAVLKLIVLAPA